MENGCDYIWTKNAVIRLTLDPLPCLFLLSWHLAYEERGWMKDGPWELHSAKNFGAPGNNVQYVLDSPTP